MNLLIYLVRTIFNLYSWLIIIRALISWIAPNIFDPNWRRLLRLIYDLTEPVLRPIRRYLPENSWGIDFSPLVAILLLSILRGFIIQLLLAISLDLRI